MREILIIIGVVVTLLLSAAYIFVWDTEPIYGDAESLKFAYEILGDPKRGKSCLRIWYDNNVENLNKNGPDKSGGAAIFIFRPIPGKEVQCPPIEVLVDRRSGEASIISLDKDGKPER